MCFIEPLLSSVEDAPLLHWFFLSLPSAQVLFVPFVEALLAFLAISEAMAFAFFVSYYFVLGLLSPVPVVPLTSPSLSYFLSNICLN